MPTAYTFVDPTYPFKAPREAIIPMPDAGKHNEDFVAIKMGDVTNNAQAHNFSGISSRHNDQLHLEIESGKLKAGETYTVEFKSSNFNDIAGYQFTLKFDQEAMVYTELKSGVLNVDESNFGMKSLENGIITTSWNNNCLLYTSLYSQAMA